MESEGGGCSEDAAEAGAVAPRLWVETERRTGRPRNRKSVGGETFVRTARGTWVNEASLPPKRGPGRPPSRPAAVAAAAAVAAGLPAPQPPPSRKRGAIKGQKKFKYSDATKAACLAELDRRGGNLSAAARVLEQRPGLERVTPQHLSCWRDERAAACKAGSNGRDLTFRGGGGVRKRAGRSCIVPEATLAEMCELAQGIDESKAIPMTAALLQPVLRAIYAERHGEEGLAGPNRQRRFDLSTRWVQRYMRMGCNMTFRKVLCAVSLTNKPHHAA